MELYEVEVLYTLGEEKEEKRNEGKRGRDCAVCPEIGGEMRRSFYRLVITRNDGPPPRGLS